MVRARGWAVPSKVKKMKRFLFALLLAMVGSESFGDPRPSAVGPPPEEEAVKELLESISGACSRKDFRAFMNCFTPKKAAAMRSKVEDAFICGDVRMEVIEHFILSSDDESVSFGVKYKIGNPEGLVLSSKVVAKRCDGSLKVDSEVIKDVKSTFSLKPPQRVAAVAVGPCPDGRCPVAPCPDGRCPPRAPVAWRAPNPANGGEEAWLPKDIMYTPGPSCANGNCGR